MEAGNQATQAAQEAAKREQVIADVRSEFLRPDITIKGEKGETKFHIEKMPAMEGWDVLEDIREAATSPLNMQHAGGIESAVQALVTSLPKRFTRELRDVMFGHVTFTNRIMQTPTVLAGDEDSAFNAIGAEPIAVYELFLRTLAVNFTPSFLAMFEKISSILKSIGWLPSTAKSPPSSPLQ